MSYLDDNDDYYPIAVMTANGLRVIEISNDDNGVIGFRFDSTDPEHYEFFHSGSSVVLLTPSERMLRNDPPYLITPTLVRQPGEGDDFYGLYARVVNAPSFLVDADSTLPSDFIIWEQ